MGVYKSTHTGAEIDSAVTTALNAYNKTEVNSLLANKQNALTAGDNIAISNDTISATDTTYTAGDNVNISNSNVISAIDTTYSAGTNVTITDGVISAQDTTYTAGDNVTITNGVIAATDTKYQAGQALSLDGTTFKANIAGDTLGVVKGGGANISITPQGVISATDTTYTFKTINNQEITGTGNINTPNTTYTFKTINNQEITGTGNINTPNTTYSAGAGINITADNKISADVASLPIASTTQKGIVQVGERLNISGGILSADLLQLKTINGNSVYGTGDLQVHGDTATYYGGVGIDLDTGTSTFNLKSATETIGGVKRGGANVTIANDGTISATDTTYTFKTINNTAITGTGNINTPNATYTAGTGLTLSGTKFNILAASDVLGGVKKGGANISIAADGTISATDTTYTFKTVNGEAITGTGDIVTPNTTYTFKTINGADITGTGNIATPNTTYSAGTNMGLSGTTFNNTNPTILKFNNVNINSTSWVADTAYEGYGFRASVALANVTTDYAVQVNFAPAECIKGIYAPFTVSYAGGVYLYASEKPTYNIVINAIATKVV